MEDVDQILRSVLGLGMDNKDLGVWQMGLRALICYIAALAMVRLGERRFMGRTTAFDMILGIMLGSVVSRAITGNAPFFASLAGGAVLVALHWMLSIISFRSQGFARLIKGNAQRLIEKGKVDGRVARKSAIGRHDLDQDLRMRGVQSPDQVHEAWIERNGQVSVIKKKGEPKVLEVEVAEGVQTVRIQWTP